MLHRNTGMPRWVVFLTAVAVTCNALRPLGLDRRRGRRVIRYRRFDVPEEEARRSTADLLPTFPRLVNDPPEPKTKQQEAVPKHTSNNRVSDVEELRRKVLDENCAFHQVPIELPFDNSTVTDLLTHDVVQLIVRRFHSQSKPGQRDLNDTAILAVAMEGGGMRGAVTAGMAAALACLGLTDAFDAVYGSSAGSVVGSYFISRQICLDVYVDILPAAQKAFVCTKRILSALMVNAVDWCVAKIWPKPLAPFNHPPGLNTSFVLDSIMDAEHGIRPLNMASFQENDRNQPLRVVTSTVRDGKLYNKCFGTADFFKEPVRRADGQRQGLFACLQASMTVPGAAGPPVFLEEKSGTDKDDDKPAAIPYFDAFCFEPLPYRSAVEEGATHVLVLCSRPADFLPKHERGIYERAVTPIYFCAHGEPAVADFFYKGGQQYIYAEDILTLHQGKMMERGRCVSVPPPRPLYGVDLSDDHERELLASERDTWKKAHLLPLKVPAGTAELPTLEQRREPVLEAVRGGFAAAFDVLAPAIGLDLSGEGLDGMAVARLVFPEVSSVSEVMLADQMSVQGKSIENPSTRERLPSPSGRPFGTRRRRRKRSILKRAGKLFMSSSSKRQPRSSTSSSKHQPRSAVTQPCCTVRQAEHLLKTLPGLQSGKMPSFAEALEQALA